MLSAIPAFAPVSDRLSTSALPRKEDFCTIAEAGYEAVISLAHPQDSLVLKHEGWYVVSSGMEYHHLLQDFAHPCIEDYERLRDLLKALQERRVWLHCTKNHRVSALVFLYNVLERGVSVEEARSRLEEIWHPDARWQEMMDLCLEKYVYQYL